jgi:CheY-like chemotaxis protein
MTRILIIEPDSDSREILRALLGHAGYEVDLCSDPADGIAHALESRPDAILCELFVRTDKGWALLEFLKGNPATAGIPVMVISAYAHQDDQERAERCGAGRFLAKPVHTEAVTAALEDLLAGQPG